MNKIYLFVIISFFSVFNEAFAERIVSDNVWSSTDIGVLELGRLVRIAGAFEDAGTYYPEGSVLRVLSVVGNTAIPNTNIKFDDIQRGFRASVTLGPVDQSTNRRIVTFQCIKEMRQAGMGSLVEAEFFDCNFGSLNVLARNIRVYDGK